MAVTPNAPRTGSSMSSGRRFLVGTNVLVATVIVVVVVGVAQLITFRLPAVRWDMTSSGVNSLSEGSEKLLRGLEMNIRITSLYFETDREDEDQSRYRRTSRDLIERYESMNPTKVSANWVNPLKEHGKYRAILARLREKTALKTEIGVYEARIDFFNDELAPKLGALMQGELDGVRSLGGTMGESSAQSAVSRVESAIQDLSTMLEDARDLVRASMLGDSPQYSLATQQLTPFYTRFGQTLTNIAKFGAAEVTQNPALTPDQVRFLSEAGNRYADGVADIEGEKTALTELEPLKYDELVSRIAPTTNAILVETDDDARVVEFSSVWPPLQQSDARAKLKNRGFKGEEKLTSAILRVTHKEQTAVVFVRYGGLPLFMGGFLPGQPPAPYTAMKRQLEDANFIVDEWDLKTSETPPTIEPTPTRTIHIVLKPSLPRQGPMGLPSGDVPFADNHRQALLRAIGDGGRALFIAGWYPGTLGVLPATYEYGDYLKNTWGITVNSELMLVEFASIEPGKYAPAGNSFFTMGDVDVTDHAIVSGALTRELGLPLCAPLALASPAPEGVELARLVTVPDRDGVWGVKLLQAYQQQMAERQYLTRAPGDIGGPFDVAVAATKGDVKIVVVSSARFAEDSVAFARGFVMTAQGFGIRMLNPGNTALTINALHWLDDNTEFMNIGKPIDTGVLAVDSESTVTAVRAFTIFAWPLLAVIGGSMVWWVRRR